MAPFADRLPALLEEQGGVVAGLDADICLTAGVMARPYRASFDRLLAATALRRGTLLISADTISNRLLHGIW